MSLQGGRDSRVAGDRPRPELTVIRGERRSNRVSARPVGAGESISAYRYRRPDLVSQIPRVLGVLSFLVATLAVFYYAQSQYSQEDPQPFGVSSFVSIFSFNDGPTDADAAAFLAAFACVLSGVGLLVSSRRMRRAEDRYGRASIVIFVLSALSVAAHVARSL